MTPFPGLSVIVHIVVILVHKSVGIVKKMRYRFFI